MKRLTGLVRKRHRALHQDPYELKVFASGKGQPVVILHGQISTHKYMRQVIDGLAKKRRVYAFDLLGFGDSPRPKRAAYTVDQHVASLHQTIAKTNLETPFVLVGHSMGAQLALAYAKAHPAQVERLVVAGLPLFESPATAYEQMGAVNPRLAWYLQGRRARVARALTGIAEVPFGILAAILVKGTYPAYIAREAVRHNWQSFERSMQNVVIGQNSLKAIDAVTQPVHFIFADKDSLNKDPAKKLKPYLNKKRTLEMVQGSHQIPLEHPTIIVRRTLGV